jgi:uncharacterized protein YodC (DUF2158 family)
MGFLSSIIYVFNSPKARFKPGDHVQSSEGGPLMIVQRVEKCRKSDTLMLSCKWFDPETKSTRTNIFSEKQVVPFDWHGAHMRNLNV